MKKNILSLALLFFSTFLLKAQTWVPVGALHFSSNGCFYPSIALDNGKPCVAFQDYFETGGKSTIMKFDGSNWVNVDTPGIGPAYADNAIAVNGNGTLYVSLGNLILKFDGSHWVNVGTATESYVKFALDNSGTPFIAFSDRSNSHKITVQKFDGSNWVNVGAAGIAARGTYLFDFTIDKTGTPFVAYADSATGKGWVLKYDGSNWINVGSTAFSTELTYQLSILADGSGNPYVCFINGGNAVVMKYNGSSWVAVGLPISNPVTSYDMASMALDNNAVPYVAVTSPEYCSCAVYPLKVVKFDGASWVPVDSPTLSHSLMNGGGLGPHAMAFDANNDLFLTFSDSSEHIQKVSVLEFASGLTTGVKANTIPNKSMDIYPNPATSTVIVHAGAEGNYTVVNELGQVMQQFYLYANENKTINNLAKGIYLISADNNPALKRKLIITQ